MNKNTYSKLRVPLTRYLQQRRGSMRKQPQAYPRTHEKSFLSGLPPLSFDVSKTVIDATIWITLRINCKESQNPDSKGFQCDDDDDEVRWIAGSDDDGCLWSPISIMWSSSYQFAICNCFFFWGVGLGFLLMDLPRKLDDENPRMK